MTLEEGLEEWDGVDSQIGRRDEWRRRFALAAMVGLLIRGAGGVKASDLADEAYDLANWMMQGAESYAGIDSEEWSEEKNA